MPGSRFFVALLPVFVPSAVLAQQAERAKTTLDLDRYLEWEWVSSPRLSPNDEQIVFTRSWVDKVNDQRQSALWIMNADGTRKRFLTKGSSPRWSPDGKRIAFLASGDPRGTQLWVLWVATREKTQLTRLDESPSGIRWSPDGRRISFSMRVPDRKKFLQIKLPRKPKGAKWAPEPKIITRLNYRRDRRGYRPKGYRHLFLVDADEGGTPRQLTSGDFDHGTGEWTPDGKQLVFSGLRVEDADWRIRESEVYAVDVEGGDVTQLTHRRGPDFGPVVSPDGEWIAYRGYDKNRDTYNVAKLHVMRRDGSNSRVLTAGLDRQVSTLLWSKDSKSIYFNVRSEGTGQVWNAPLAEEPRILTSGRRYVSASDIGKDGTLVGTMTDPHRAGDIVTFRELERDYGTARVLRTLTRVNHDVLRDVTLGEVEEFRYKSVDDLEIQGWIVKPPDFDPRRKYPLILQIHGGPHGMYGNRFSFERQNHAAHGFVVLYTNPRGSAGYGKEFGNAILNAYPGRDFDDLMRGVDEVLAKGYVDADKLFVYGGSGGGVLTAWIVGKTDRFKAAVSMYPVINWISFVGTTDGPYWYHNFAKFPWEDITEHWRRSPLRLVGKVKTPTLLITGELDLRTPMAQTEEYYQALKWRKVPTAMIRIPDEYHGAAGRHVSNRLRRILYVRAWFQKHMGEPRETLPIEATGAKRR